MFTFVSLTILYEDNHVIVVYKPAGVLVQGDETGDSTLMDEVKAYLKEKYHKPGDVFLGMVHRLDRPVSGIVVFGKTSKGAERLSKQFREHTARKIYHALVTHHPKPTAGTLVHYILKDPVKNVVTVYNERTGDALRAELSYETVKTLGRYALLKIELKSGRPHQIRAQLAAIGCTIVGDLKYGAPTPLPDKSIALAATSLEFKLATRDERKELLISIPETWFGYISSN